MNSHPKKKQTELTAEQRIQLESVATMNVPMLRVKYREVFGEDPKSHNAAYLRKRIVWRIQEKALGGLSDRARQRLRELGQEAPHRYRGGPVASFSTAADDLTASTVVFTGAASQPSALASALPAGPSPAIPAPSASLEPSAPLAPPAGLGAALLAPPVALAAPPAALASDALAPGAREALAALAPGALQAPALAAPAPGSPPAPVLAAPAGPVLAAGPVPASTPWPAAPASAPWSAAAPAPALSRGSVTGTAPGHLQLTATPAGPAEERDPRLPPPGTLLKRVHGGLTHTVQVLPTGFLYNGVPYASLSKLARAITGSNWNGFTFFGLTRPWKSEDAA